ncbi:MAG: extracellular factor (EF) 3-hydroxypalmitic acid methyl ester biosynthesis protein [Bradymonadia bacterium]|jgi:extracellular factor (EF) 3-hydroxypalmitic acid methyl ester biosynthesis protein
MTGTYEHLSGGAGSTRHFRTERYAARQWLNHVRPTLIINGESRTIYDMSMNGIAFYVPDLAEAPASEERCQIVLSIGESIVFKGEGEVTRRELTNRGGKLALRLFDGFLDIPKIVALHDELALAAELHRTPAALLADLPAEYKEVCGEMVFFFRRYKETLDRFESLLAPQGTEGEERLQELYDATIPRFRSEWNALRLRANELVPALEASAEIKAAAKVYTEALVTPELLCSPLWGRCVEKPLGYPGDFEIMNMLYRGVPLGTSAYERMLFQIGLEQPIAACVPPRMHELRQEIRRAVSRGATGRPVHVTSLGSGPAKEVDTYLGGGAPENEVHFTLIDQDYGALSYAYEQIYRHTGRLGSRASAECLYVSFVQFLKSEELFGRLPKQDLLYSAGLFDYLETAQAQMLVAALYDKVAPGGTLLIGNMKATPDGTWSLEYIADWTLIYRTREQMLELAAFVSGAEIDVREESTGHTYLLTLRKP